MQEMEKGKEKPKRKKTRAKVAEGQETVNIQTKEKMKKGHMDHIPHAPLPTWSPISFLPDAFFLVVVANFIVNGSGMLGHTSQFACTMAKVTAGSTHALT